VGTAVEPFVNFYLGCQMAIEKKLPLETIYLFDIPWFHVYKDYFQFTLQMLPVRMLKDRCNSTLLIQAKSTGGFQVVPNALFKIDVNFFCTQGTELIWPHVKWNASYHKRRWVGRTFFRDINLPHKHHSLPNQHHSWLSNKRHSYKSTTKHLAWPTTPWIWL